MKEDFKKMLANEGMIEASAAERGVRGASVARQLVQNSANFGISQALRSKGLREAGYDARGVYGDCLLYTSPSPRDMWTSRMPSSA